MLSQFFHLLASLPDEHLRAQVNDHFVRTIGAKSTQDERKAAAPSSATERAPTG
jgi:hypothetical protein